MAHKWPLCPANPSVSLDFMGQAGKMTIENRKQRWRDGDWINIRKFSAFSQSNAQIW